MTTLLKANNANLQKIINDAINLPIGINAEEILLFIDKQIDSIINEINNLTSIEKDYKNELEMKLDWFEKNRNQVGNINFYNSMGYSLLYYPNITKLYTDKNNQNQSVPILAVYNLYSSNNSNSIEIFVPTQDLCHRHSDKTSVYHKDYISYIQNDKKIKTFYQKTINAPIYGSCCINDSVLMGWIKNNEDFYLYKSNFTGKIPKTTKFKINKSLKYFSKDQLFIVAEANWNKVEEPDPDPLIVAWDGANLWLIDAFDVTPVEQAMLDISKINL